MERSGRGSSQGAVEVMTHVSQVHIHIRVPRYMLDIRTRAVIFARPRIWDEFLNDW